MSEFNIHKWRYNYLNEHHNDGDFPQEMLNNSLESFLEKLRKKSTSDYDDVEDIIKKHFSIKEMNTTGGGSSFQSGNGEGYATPKSFKKPKNKK